MQNVANTPIGRTIVKISNTIHKMLGTEQTSRNSTLVPLLPNDQCCPWNCIWCTNLVWIYSISLLSKCFDSKGKKAMAKSFPLLFPRFLDHVVLVNHSLGSRVSCVFCYLLRPHLCGLLRKQDSHDLFDFALHPGNLSILGLLIIECFAMQA